MIRARRSTGKPTNGFYIVKGGAWKLRCNPKVSADNLLQTRFGWLHHRGDTAKRKKKGTFVPQLTQALSTTYLANPLIQVCSIPHRSRDIPNEPRSGDLHNQHRTWDFPNQHMSGDFPNQHGSHAFLNQHKTNTGV